MRASPGWLGLMGRLAKAGGGLRTIIVHHAMARVCWLENQCESVNLTIQWVPIGHRFSRIRRCHNLLPECRNRAVNNDFGDNERQTKHALACFGGVSIANPYLNRQ